MTVYPDYINNAWTGTYVVHSGDEFYTLDLNDHLSLSSPSVVSRLNVELGSGDDWLQLTMYGYTTADAGPGNDTIFGGSSDSKLYGGDGNDEVHGEGNYDNLYGGDGWDTLYGGNGTDFMYGGSGSDDLWGDADPDYLFGDSEEDYLNGGDANDSLYGGSGNDRLDGWSGADRLSGDDGDDTYWIDDVGDRVLEHKNEGNDTVWVGLSWKMADNVENVYTFTFNDVILKGNGLNNGMGGGVGRDVVNGGSGKDTVAGWTNNDTLIGGAGKDVFHFDFKGASNADKVKDYHVKDDSIHLERDVFTNIAIDDNVKLTKDQFHASKSGKAADAEDRITYDTDNGKLYWDPDGKGGAPAEHFATVVGHPHLTASEFLLV